MKLFLLVLLVSCSDKVSLTRISPPPPTIQPSCITLDDLPNYPKGSIACNDNPQELFFWYTAERGKVGLRKI